MSAGLLFDAPGPKARRRHRVLTVVGLVLAAAALYWVVRTFGSKDQLTAEKWKPFLTKDAWSEYLLIGLWHTIEAALISIVLALAFGLVLGVGRLSENTAIRWVCSTIVEVFRSVPVLIMMIFAFGAYTSYGVFRDDLNPLAAVVTGLTLYNGSVMAELVRSGVHGLPKGQREAGVSIGLTAPQTMHSILLPQALTAMLPAFIGQLVVILKDSALGTIITYDELLSWSRSLGSAYANTIPAYIVAALLFIVINFSLTLLARKVQQRLSRRGRALPAGEGAPGAGVTTGIVGTVSTAPPSN
jgi:glutamate transport system permease protein